MPASPMQRHCSEVLLAGASVALYLFPVNDPSDAAFTGSIPEIYDRCLVPLIFDSYAIDMAARVAHHKPDRVLEVAAGTGALTRQLVRTLSSNVTIIATDLNQAMLDQAVANSADRTVQWRQADVMKLPFSDQEFDVVCCQFGVMFFPDKVRAFREARRVLRDGGIFLFNVWNGLENNAFPQIVSETLTEFFPDNPPQFLSRIPYGYFDQNQIADDLRNAGFERPATFAVVTESSRAESPQSAATGFCQGTPIRAEIAAHGESALASVTAAVASALEKQYGSGPIEGKIQATVVEVTR